MLLNLKIKNIFLQLLLYNNKKSKKKKLIKNLMRLIKTKLLNK